MKLQTRYQAWVKIYTEREESSVFTWESLGFYDSEQEANEAIENLLNYHDWKVVVVQCYG